jgi:hypothetical protein
VVGPGRLRSRAPCHSAGSHERQRLIGDFLDAVFDDLGAEPSFAGIRRSMTPELPDDPEAEQVQAWAELAELSQDPGFRACIRRMARDEAAERDQGNTSVLRRDLVAVAGLATLIIAYLLRSGRQSARGGAMAEALALDTAAAQA